MHFHAAFPGDSLKLWLPNAGSRVQRMHVGLNALRFFWDTPTKTADVLHMRSAGFSPAKWLLSALLESFPSRRNFIVWPRYKV